MTSPRERASSSTGVTGSRRVRKFRPYVLTEPEEKILTEKSVSGFSRLGPALRRAARRDHGRPRRRRDRVRGGDVAALLAPIATTPARRPRPSPSRSRPGCARGRSSSTRSPSTSRSTTGCAATRPGSRRATSRTTRPTRRSQALDRRGRRAATTSPSATTRSRRSCSASTGSRYYDRMAPLAEDTTQTSRGARRGSSSSTRSPTSRARPAASSSASSARAGSTLRRATDKRPGAFCATNVPGVHPYVFMNYTGDRRSVLTLAHELGHGLHGYPRAAARALQRLARR